MFSKSKKFNSFIAILILVTLLLGAMLPVIQADKLKYTTGFDKGPSYTNVVPIKRAILVNYDERSYLDDYAYLASVPTAVFKDPNSNKLVSNPLLFYQDEYDVKNDTERSLDPYEGLKYFMDDWTQYVNKLDEMTLINLDKNKLLEWSSNHFTELKSNDPYDLAKKIALNDWSYSDDAVIAVIEKEFEKTDFEMSSELSGMIYTDKEIIKKTFYTEQLDKLNPRPHEFDVPEGYKYLKARTWWSSIYIGTPEKSALPLHINITLPTADPDTQLYCQYEDEWMQVEVTQGWNIGGMDKEKMETYIYNSGKWYLTVTDIPTFGVGKNGKLLDVIKNMIKGARYQTDITLYPGDEKEILEAPPFGCRDATFKLTWDDPRVKLGLSIIGPYGEEVLSSSEEDKNYQEIHLNQLGEPPEGKNYKICVFAMDELSEPVDYKIEYSWKQNFSIECGDALSSATEGAVLASSLNAPLLYVSAGNLPQATKDALYKLGVENIYLVNIGSLLSKEVEEQLKEIANVKKEYVKLERIYEEIMSLTGQNDVIFSTIDPWTYWYVTEMKPGGETEAGLFIGPAAYCAAHHGSPVLIVDMHPELSSAIVWHTEFWRRNGKGQPEPTIAPMYLTVSKVIDFLKKIGIDKEETETMITISGQYEIGATWDRAFVGNYNPGRIFGSPVDTAYWISRNVFYPAIIFNNPGMDPDGVTLEQGSYSKRRNILPWGKNGLRIVKDNEDVTLKYPVVQMYITYNHHLNERFYDYYGFQYQTADKIVFGETSSNNPIDLGVVPGKEDQEIWPDFTDSEVTPLYLLKGGYENVFSTNFEPLIENLNAGVLMFISHTHGTGAESGLLITWDPKSSALGKIPIFGYIQEENPWRGYDWYLGSTENPDTMTMEVHGIIPAILANPKLDGLLPIGEDYWPSERPIIEKLSKIPILKWLLPKGWRDLEAYKDGIVGSHTISSLATSHSQWTGYTMDDKLKNIYSCGWINTACLPAYKYMHLTMVRHGSVFQVIDPWPTSWYSYWSITIPRDIVLGYTIGEAYSQGISHVGILYATDTPQWWWDGEQNVCFFGDPDLRPYVPKTDYSSNNHWEKKDVKALSYDASFDLYGHMPYGATKYPNEKEPQPFLPTWLLLIIVLILILLIALAGMSRKKR